MGSQPRERPISPAWMALLVKVEVVTKMISRTATFSRAPYIRGSGASQPWCEERSVCTAQSGYCRAYPCR